MKTAVFGAALLLASPLFAQPFTPIFDAPSGMFLGAAQGRKWMTPEKAVPFLKARTAIRFYDGQKLLKTGTASLPKSTGAPCPDTLFSNFSPPAPTSSQFAVGGNSNAIPRPVRAENPRGATYRKIVTDILRENGLRSPAQIQQLWRVDLEGDGRDETLISASRKDDYGDPNRISPQTRAGDYSILLLRKIVGGRVKNILLASEFHRKNVQFSAPNFFRLAGVFDANGDGKMEILMRGAYYEGEWVTLFEMQGATPKIVLETGCGA